MLVKDFLSLLQDKKVQFFLVVILVFLLTYCLFFRFKYKIYDTNKYSNCVKVVKIDNLFNKVDVSLVCPPKNKQNRVKQSKQSDLFSDIDAEIDAEVLGE